MTEIAGAKKIPILQFCPKSAAKQTIAAVWWCATKKQKIGNTQWHDLEELDEVQTRCWSRRIQGRIVTKLRDDVAVRDGRRKKLFGPSM